VLPRYFDTFLGLGTMVESGVQTRRACTRETYAGKGCQIARMIWWICSSRGRIPGASEMKAGRIAPTRIL